MRVTCGRFRSAISARLDGEEPGMAADALDAHLASCPACRAWQAAARELGRGVHLRPADQVPDLTGPILAAVGEEQGRDRDSRRTALRAALLAVGLVQLLAAVPALVLGAGADLPVHAARHIGSFDAAIAVGFLVAAWRPARIPGLLPVMAALALCLLAGAAVDVVGGSAPAPAEATHLVVLIGLAAAWLLARSPSAGPRRWGGVGLATS